MRVVVQRVSEGGVEVTESDYRQDIARGMVVLLGIKSGDADKDVIFLADKCSNLRIFEDENDKMNLSVRDIGGEALIISQFTLYGDASRGNRPGFTDAAKPDEAIPLYEKFIKRMKQNLGEDKVKSGIFGAMMNIEMINNGPVTVIIDSK